MTVKDFSDHFFIRTSKEKISQLGLENSASRLIPAGSVLLATRMAVGKAAINLVEVAINQDLKALFCSSRLDPRYLMFFLASAVSHLEEQSSGATVKGITIDDVQALPIPLLELTEQHRIAALLMKADRLRRMRRYALELSDRFLQSVFLKMFAKNLAEHQAQQMLGDLVTITGGGTPSREKAEFFQGNIPWLTAKDMINDYIRDTQEHITEDAIRASATKLVPATSVLLVVKSKVLMHRLPLAITEVPLCHGQDIKSIQCSKWVLPEFVRFALGYYERKLLNWARGANTEGLTLPMLRELPIPNISLEKQQEFSSIVQTFKRLRSQQREAERQAEHLFQTLLHRTFANESVASNDGRAARAQV